MKIIIMSSIIILCNTLHPRRREGGGEGKYTKETIRNSALIVTVRGAETLPKRRFIIVLMQRANTSN